MLFSISSRFTNPCRNLYPEFSSCSTISCGTRQRRMLVQHKRSQGDSYDCWAGNSVIVLLALTNVYSANKQRMLCRLSIKSGRHIRYPLNRDSGKSRGSMMRSHLPRICLCCACQMGRFPTGLLLLCSKCLVEASLHFTALSSHPRLSLPTPITVKATILQPLDHMRS